MWWRGTTTPRRTRTIRILNWVGYGDRTVDEMGHAWMNVVYLSDAEYKERVEKYGEGVTNGVKPEKTTQQQQ